MASIQKDNKETSKELERISRLEDPIKMMQDHKEQQKIQYQQLKLKLSQMTSANGSLTRSPNGNSTLHESIFDRNRPQQLKHTRINDQKRHGKSLFNGMQRQALSLINGGNDEEEETDYSQFLNSARIASGESRDRKAYSKS